MKRQKTLSASSDKTSNQPGHYGDGRGSHDQSLPVKPMTNNRQSKTWCQRVLINGKPVNDGPGLGRECYWVRWNRIMGTDHVFSKSSESPRL